MFSQEKSRLTMLSISLLSTCRWDGCAPCHGYRVRVNDRISSFTSAVFASVSPTICREQIRDVQSLEVPWVRSLSVATVAKVGQLKAHRLQFGYDGGQAYGRHDILSLELVVGGSFLLHYRFCGCGFPVARAKTGPSEVQMGSLLLCLSVPQGWSPSLRAAGWR